MPFNVLGAMNIAGQRKTDRAVSALVPLAPTTNPDTPVTRLNWCELVSATIRYLASPSTRLSAAVLRASWRK